VRRGRPASNIFSRRVLWQCIAVIMILTAVSGQAGAQDSRQRDYVAYCSSCHGTDARGHGRETYRVPGFRPTDLTQLTKTHGGQFPAREVRQIIDGRRALVPGHTDWETNMPLWGLRFQEEGKEFTPESEAKVRRRVDGLVNYIRSIQR
jgi:hypothetical protein